MKSKLETMIIEIDITKCNKTMEEIFKKINELEKEDLSKINLDVKDVYFK